MSNWAFGEMQLVLPTKNVDKFLEYSGGKQAPYFYRTSFELYDREDNPRGLTKLTFGVQCASSAVNCLIDGVANAEGCLSLETVCLELEVRRLAATFEERGMMFGERITYDQESGIEYESYDLPEKQLYIELDDDEAYIEESTANEEPSVTLDDLIQGVPV